MTIEALRVAIASGTVDTVVLALTDMQGRLQGKRLHAAYFLDEVLGHGSEACNYLLAVDVEMNTVGGYAITSWDTGYGDFAIRPDLATLRRVPSTLRDACELFEASATARKAFGDDVVDHYTNAARVELAAFDSAVTDWERVRGFERL